MKAFDVIGVGTDSAGWPVSCLLNDCLNEQDAIQWARKYMYRDSGGWDYLHIREYPTGETVAMVDSSSRVIRD